MLNHKGTITLKTERLILRRFTVDDAHDMYENWAKDPRVTRWLSWYPHRSVEETRETLENWCASYERPNLYSWVMEYEGRAIGNISVTNINAFSEWCEIGYCIGYDFWGKGFTAEALRAVSNFLFDEVGFHRLQINHGDGNPASGRVALKCGFRHEGIMRKRAKSSETGEFFDVHLYGLLKEDR